MRFTSKILYIFICTSMLSICLDQVQLKAESFIFLSPSVVVNKAEMQKIFTSVKTEKILFIDNDDVSLTGILGQGEIKKIFDVATGNGSWMRDCLKQPWAAYNVSVIGFELEEPDVYPQDMRSIVSRVSDWEGLNIVHSKDDPDFPENNSLDLIHEAFMDASRVKIHKPRLDLYNRLLKDNGWMLLAHVSHKYYIPPEKFTQWLDKNNYAYKVLLDSKGLIPDDYPRTYWWNYFRNESRLGIHSHSNYLIIAQKKLADKNTFIDQCEQSI